MRLKSFRLRGIRCFVDTGEIELSAKCNIFVGQNNSGKSTLLRAITGWQITPLAAPDDVRPGHLESDFSIVIDNIRDNDYIQDKVNGLDTIRYKHLLQTPTQDRRTDPDGIYCIGRNWIVFPGSIFRATWPSNHIVPFSAKRKASEFVENINIVAQSGVDGTFSNLYARIDRVVAPGSAAHVFYREAVEKILGVFITTQASANGKKAGYFYDEENFVTLDRMGDGVVEIVALIVDLSLSRGKLFVLEEPETNLHPNGLKALLNLIRESARHNQFIIATHSNIVVRELADTDTAIYQVSRDGTMPDSPSVVQPIARTPSAHTILLRELGYEFGDFDLYDGWLFLEESSAETIIRDILIPWFAPLLVNKLRTFSAGGIANLEPSVSEFQRLITFIHLEPVYQDRLWVRADGDDPGRTTIENLAAKFPYLTRPRSDTFEKDSFERYYPTVFAEKVHSVLSIQDKKNRRTAKATLLADVVRWTKENEDEARLAWTESAAEQITLISIIREELEAK